MPTRAALPCRHHGCPRLVPKAGYCEDHKREEYKRQDQRRGSSHERGYGAKWRRARELFLAEHPLCECEDCKANGWITPSTVVDHIIPHRGDLKLFWDRKNWQAMSKTHHDAKTARESAFGRAPPVSRQPEMQQGQGVVPSSQDDTRGESKS